MAFEMKCICPDADLRNMASSEYQFFTLAEAAAVASGYAPCCTQWRTNQEFRYHCAGPCDAMDLWEQTLRRAVAGGELKSMRSRLEPTARLIRRSDLTSWMEEHTREETAEDDEKNNSPPLLTQRAQAIAAVIRDNGWKSNMITIPEKKVLRKLVSERYPKLYFTNATFAKAWIKGGELNLFSIKDKQKYDKYQRHLEKERRKKL